MKILLVNKFHWRKGGSETYYFALADGLRALGHEVAFFSMEDERNEPTEWSRYFVTNRDYNGPSSIVDKAKAAQSLVYSKEAREKFDALCREFQPDVIHLNLTHRQITFSILDAPWLKQHPTPVVYTSHDLILACPSYLMLDSEGNVCDSCLGGHFGNCLKKKCVKGSIAKSALAVAEAEWLKRHKTYSRLDRIICPSEFMRNKFIEAGLPERQLVLMRNFLNPDSMSREVANQNNEDPYMLYLGRLSREKGVLTLVHAFEKAAPVIPDWRLVIAGDGPECDAVKVKVSAMPNEISSRIELVGYKTGDALRGLVNRATLAAAPSEWLENAPYAVLEALAAGKPVIRTDLADIVRELYKKSDRIVISTNGFFTDRIIALAEEFPQVGIRISIEGLQQTNDEIRGLQNGFNRGYETLKKLVEMKHPDVGFGMTVQDRNAADLVPLYKLSDELGMEFATASLHNSFYFVEAKNIIKDRPMVAQNFEDLVNELLKSNEPKKWFRAYFNMGLINYIYGQKRLLPCDMAFDTFFIDPYGDVMPCNGTKEKLVMGNLNDESWDELWESAQAEKVRGCVRHCDRNCWMIGSVSPAMHKYIWKPASWVLAHKLKPGKKFDMHELPIVRDYESGKVTKEELDALSTCDMHAAINDGLSDASRADAHVYETEEAL